MGGHVDDNDRRNTGHQPISAIVNPVSFSASHSDTPSLGKYASMSHPHRSGDGQNPELLEMDVLTIHSDIQGMVLHSLGSEESQPDVFMSECLLPEEFASTPPQESPCPGSANTSPSSVMSSLFSLSAGSESSGTSTTSSLCATYFPVRYFVMKSLTQVSPELLLLLRYQLTQRWSV